MVRLMVILFLICLYLFCTSKILLSEETTCLIGNETLFKKYLKYKSYQDRGTVWEPQEGANQLEQMAESHVPLPAWSEGLSGTNNMTEGNNRLLLKNLPNGMRVYVHLGPVYVQGSWRTRPTEEGNVLPLNFPWVDERRRIAFVMPFTHFPIPELSGKTVVEGT